MELKGVLQTYAWGKLGSSSLVARLHGGHIDPKTAYAELWMGTHPNGTAEVLPERKSLKSFIEENPHVLGKLKYYWENNDNLPFLFKVLSVRKALSIQVHPDKDTAELLHHNFPSVYKDPNHKPEMAIALTDFYALCGFRPIDELKDVCVNIPELRNLVSPELLASFKETGDKSFLRNILHTLLIRKEEDINSAIQKYFERLENSDDDLKEKYRFDLIKKLSQEFPGDSGIFVSFFLNNVHLSPGESIYLPSGLPHAYLSGDCIECMACSDNVVRAGLTPKFKDVDTLLSILDYQSYTPKGVKLEPEIISPFSSRYNPPIPDFGVTRVVIPGNESWLSPAHDSCQVFIVVAGEGTCVGEPIKCLKPSSSDPRASEETDKVVIACNMLKERSEWHIKFGTIMFLPPYGQYKISAKEQLQIYFAYTNSQNVLPDLPLFVNLH